MLLLTGGAQLGDDWVLSDDDFTPTTDIAWYSSFWAEDPLWTNRPADGVAVSRWRNAGTLRTSGAHLAADGLVLPGVAGNNASTPDADALDITGDIDIRCDVTATNWTPGANSSLVTKQATSGQFSWQFRIDATTGRLRLVTTADGTTPRAHISTASPAAVGQWLRVTRSAATGDVIFYTSPDNAAWTQLGTTVAGTVEGIFASTAPVEFGSVLGGTAPLDGTIRRVQIRDGIDGTLVLDADFRTRPGATSFTAATGQPVTVLSTFSANQATGASQPTFRGSVATLNNRPAVDFDGTDDRLVILDGVSLAQPFSVVWIGSYDVVGSNRRFMSHSSGTVERGVGIYSSPFRWLMNSGTVLEAATSPTADTSYMVRAYFNGASSNLTANGSLLATGNANTNGADQIVLGAGRSAPSTYANHLDGKTAFLGIFPGDITTSPRWPDFKAWVRSHYNVTVA